MGALGMGGGKRGQGPGRKLSEAPALTAPPDPPSSPKGLKDKGGASAYRGSLSHYPPPPPPPNKRQHSGRFGGWGGGGAGGGGEKEGEPQPLPLQLAWA